MKYEMIRGEALSTLRTMPSASVDAVVTDPPYSSGGAFRGDRMGKPSQKYQTTQTVKTYPEFSGDNRDQRAYRYWSALWLSECLRVAKEGAPILVFTDWRQLPTTTDALQAGGWVWRGIVPWDKTEAARPDKGRFRQQCEYVVWGSKGRMPLDRNVPVLPGCFRESVYGPEKFHITGKPINLMRNLLRIIEPGGLVLDPFAGSGSTGVAALMEGYRFLGIECEEEYHQIASRRLSEVHSQPMLYQNHAEA